MADEIARVGVVGCGQMGSGIAEVCARNGLTVRVFEVDRDRLDSGRKRIEASLRRALSRGKISEAEHEQTVRNIVCTLDLGDFADCDLTVEAVVEDAQAKAAVFTALDKILTNEHAILATNTSSIPIMKIAMATTRPEYVIGMHFFNPTPVLTLLELVPSLVTSTEVENRAEAFAAQRLGRIVIRSQDRAGFIVNALLVPYILAAVRMLESGFASAQAIDSGMVVGCNHPMGPLHLADLIGLDTVKSIAEAMYEEFKEPRYSPAPLLLRMVDAGLLGNKSGRGFFEH